MIQLFIAIFQTATSSNVRLTGVDILAEQGAMMGDSGGSCSTMDFGTQCSVQPVLMSAGTQAQVSFASASSQTQVPPAPELASTATGTEVGSAHKCTQTVSQASYWPYFTVAVVGLVALSLARRQS
ncbi:unnamed protein product [Durusdinium trenchii]|uniref:Uncharacterized protein n=1 Tax=Durusdinium trenchii TaxID=1381693 RepID=A0ABP0Q320_9DINO